MIGNSYSFAKKMMALLWFHIAEAQEVRLKSVKIMSLAVVKVSEMLRLKD